jgi:rubrerythrin
MITKQMKEEEGHAKIFTNQLKKFNFEETPLYATLQQFYEFCQECVNNKDWVACITCQAALEELAMASFGEFYNRVDDKETQEILLKVIEEERQHLAFCMDQLQKFVKNKETKEKIEQTQRMIVQVLAKGVMFTTLTSDQRNAAIKVLKQAHTMHTNKMKTLNIDFPQAI